MADVFGKIDQGAVIGDNLATAIYANSGNGVVHDAAVRDIDGIQELPNFTQFRARLSPHLCLAHHHAGRGQLSGAHRRRDSHAR